MEILVPKYWTEFNIKNKKGKLSFNGIMFEELVRLILEIYFDGQWMPTSITWDGGKDFVDRSIQGEESWAECKMYKATLSIKAVSNTLVMAINKRNAVRKVILFSYSPLNANAESHLARFSESTGITVQVFDDSRLESLILKSERIKGRFFPDAKDFVPQDSVLESVSIDSLFSTDINIHSSQLQRSEGLQKSRIPFLPLNTSCLFELIFRSNSVNDKFKVSIDFSKMNKEDSSILLLNISSLNLNKERRYTYTLKPSELMSLKLYLAPVSIDLTEIPSLTVRLPKNIEHSIPSIPIRVSRLNHPSLIGSYIYNALDDFNERISTKNEVNQTIISGKSGVGKTRFMEEAQLRLLTQNYSLFKMDGRELRTDSFHGFISSILTQIWRIPNIYLLNNDNETFAQSNTGNTLFDRVCGYIIEAESRSEVLIDKIDELLNIVTEGILNQRAALLIDNVQKFDAITLQFLEQLSSRITGTIGQTCLVLTFNVEELIYSTEANILHNKLKRQSIEENKASRFIEIPEFRENDVKLFLDTICGNISEKELFTNYYPRLTKFILENVLPRPLDLYQLFLAAQDEQADIARVENGYFFVKDSRRFLDLIKSVNKKTFTILNERLQNLKFNDTSLKILVTLGYVGKSNIDFIKSITNSNYDDIDYLIDGGWLRHSELNTIDFYHPSIERFIIEARLNSKIKKELRFLSEISMNDVAKNIMTSEQSEDFSLALFTLSKDKASHFFNALNEVKKYGNTVPTIRKRIYAKDLYDYILYLKDLDPEDYIEMLHLICLFSSEGEPLEFVNRLQYQRRNLRSFAPRTNKSANALCKIMREYASYLNLLGTPEKGDIVLVEEIERLNSFSDSINTDVVNRIRVNYLNRRCVCLKSMDLFEEAEDVGLLALDIAKKFDFKEFICLALIDLSIIFRNEIKNFGQYKDYLSEAISFYNQHSKEIDLIDSSIEFACLENASHLYGLEGNIKVSIELADKLIRKVRKKYSHYYLLRGLTAKAVMMTRNELRLKKPEKHAMRELLSLAKEIEDISIVSLFDRFYIKALHLQSILNSSDGNPAQAEAFYSGALIKIEAKYRDLDQYVPMPPSEKSLIWDAVNFWNLEKIKNPFPINISWINKHYLDLNIAEHLESKQFKEPYFLFASGQFNYPFP